MDTKISAKAHESKLYPAVVVLLEHLSVIRHRQSMRVNKGPPRSTLEDTKDGFLARGFDSDLINTLGLIFSRTPRQLQVKRTRERRCAIEAVCIPQSLLPQGSPMCGYT